MLNLESVFSNPILIKQSNTLIKVRISLYSLAFIHLVVIALILLTIDFRQSEDTDVRLYHLTRWKLITSWFNLISLVYFPTCIYCDWRELRHEAKQKHVQLLNQVRYILFTSILLPTTAFGDILFWRVWNLDRALIAPISVDKLVPFWTQHSMHTVSLIVMLLDLVLVPRERPKNMTTGLTVLSVFLACYVYVCIQSYLEGVLVYPGLKQFTGHKFPLLIIYVFVENFFYYTSQFFIVDMLISLVYFPTCIYCDWRELRHEAKQKHVQLLNQVRYILFTSILLPTTAFGDILFWRVWNLDRALIAPISVDKLVPFWTQHSMHTVSLIVMLLDLVLVPRERPKNMTTGLTVLSVFLACYVYVCIQSYLEGVLVYPGLKQFTGHKFPLLIIYVFVENFFYYTSQFFIVDMVWGQSSKKIS